MAFDGAEEVLRRSGAVGGVLKTELFLAKGLAPQVGSHHHHGTAEVGQSPPRIAETPFAKDLEQQVEKPGMGLLEFVEQDDSEGLLSNTGGQHALLRRAADQPLHRHGIGILAHVDPDHSPAILEKELGQALCHFRFAHAGGADEHERSDRSIGAIQVRLHACQEIDDDINRRGLADHAAAEPVVRGLKVERLVLVEEDPRQTGLARKGLVDRGRRNRAALAGCFQQVAKETQREPGEGRVGRVAAVEASQGAEGVVRQRQVPGRGPFSGGQFQDPIARLDRGRFDFKLGKGAEQSRHVALENRLLLGGAFGDRLKFSTFDGGTQEVGHALVARGALAHVHQLHEVAEVDHGLGLVGFAAEGLALLLPHGKADHSRHEACTAGGPERGAGQAVFGSASGQLAHKGRLAHARRSHQQYALPLGAREVFRKT